MKLEFTNMSRAGSEEATCLPTPQFDLLVERGGGDESAIGREGDVVDELLVADHASQWSLLPLWSP